MEWIIDSDAHITEAADLWTRRLPAKFKERGPILVRDPDSGVDMWTIAGDKPIMPVGHTAVAGWGKPFPDAPRNMDEVPKASHDAHARLAYLDSVGIWAQLIYPNVGGFGNQAFLDLKDPELMLACVQAYNDFLTDWASADPRRLIAVTATPFWDVEASVAEIERCAKKGHRAVLFSGEPQAMGMPLLGDRHWDPIWTVAQDLGQPISFHIGSGNFMEGFTPDRIQTHGLGATLVRMTVNLFLDNGKQLVDLLTCGLLARFPELKFVSVESGIGFLPFVLESLDHAFEYSDIRSQNPEYDLLPSEYFRRQVFGCYFFEEIAPQLLIEQIGVDNILFETDYPHPVCLYGNVREKIDAGLKGHNAEVRDKILWRNAAQLYRIDEPDRDVAEAIAASA
jgi:predicted TIM-barrel fold metal-dependent hydrolase